MIIEKKILKQLFGLFPKAIKNNSILFLKSEENYTSIKIIKENELFTFEYKIFNSNDKIEEFIFELDDFENIIKSLKEKELIISNDEINGYPIFEIDSNLENEQILYINSTALKLNKNFNELIKYCQENKKILKKSVFLESTYFICDKTTCYHIDNFNLTKRNFSLLESEYFDNSDFYIAINKNYLKAIDLFSNIKEDLFISISSDKNIQEIFSKSFYLKIELPKINKKIFKMK